MKRALLLFYIVLVCNCTFSQSVTITGSVTDADDNTTIPYAAVQVTKSGQYAITNNNGKFSIEGVDMGITEIKVSILGYSTTAVKVNIQKNNQDLLIKLRKYNLALEEVVVTAQPKNKSTSSYKMNSTALEHEQINDVADIQSLLPGGKTPTENNLAKGEQEVSLRSSLDEYEDGNAAFGTAIEVDGVRISNNASFDGSSPLGVDTRNLSTVNIGVIEVVTGIPSVEFGDLSNGIVKINTKKGPTPLTTIITLNPNTKQIGIGKGFYLGQKYGVLNISAERIKSIKNTMSPYTAYDRNTLSLVHEKHFKNNLSLTSGFTVNIGGYNSESDPDLFTGTYTKNKDNVMRGYLKTKWFLDKKWITNLELFSSVNYSDKFREIRTNENSAASEEAIHTTEIGYFVTSNYDENPDAPIILLPTGYWYRTRYFDNKLLDISLKTKADWFKDFGKSTSKLLAGIHYSNSGNLGQGTYYSDMRYAPTWREYNLSQIPHTNYMAAFLEEKLSYKISKRSKVGLRAGLRSDNIYINQSDYGLISTLSPRINANYTFKKNQDAFIRRFNLYAGWGKSDKLPPLFVLYPKPGYSDNRVFTASSTNNNIAYEAFYTLPGSTVYNPDLKWQSTQQTEIGININLKGTKVNLSVYHNRTLNPYTPDEVYTPYTYKQTDQSSMENSPISIEDRRYSINQNTGIVTIHDASERYDSYELDYKERNTFQNRQRFTNGSPVERIGVDWIIDFAKLRLIKTSIRLDGNFYYYKSVKEYLYANRPSGQPMTNGQPYQYIGYYVGTNSTANGRISKRVNTNLTIKTHIPEIRMIISLKIESTLYRYSKNLSEYSGGERGFVLEDPEGYHSNDYDIYNRNEIVGIYPLYYTTWENPDKKIAFEESFLWAKENDTELYTGLTKLVKKSNYKSTFNESRISPYYSANINVTKEIGDILSISFFAKNFLHNMKKIHLSEDNTHVSLYNSRYIPRFYYGLSMRLKI